MHIYGVNVRIGVLTQTDEDSVSRRRLEVTWPAAAVRQDVSSGASKQRKEREGIVKRSLELYKLLCPGHTVALENQTDSLSRRKGRRSRRHGANRETRRE